MENHIVQLTNDGCEYCNGYMLLCNGYIDINGVHSYRLRTIISETIQEKKYLHTLLQEYTNGGSIWDYWIHVKYCPMCGRKFE